MQVFADDYLAGLDSALAGVDRDAVGRLADRLVAAAHADAHVFVAGNGGSATTAAHIACDLAKTALGSDPRSVRPRVTALGTNPALLTAWANDAGYDTVFAEEVKTFGRAGDVLLVVSVSGNSPNLLVAVRTAAERGLATVGLLGRDGGALRELLDDYVLVPDDDFGHVESAHLVLGHLLTRWIAENLGR